MNTRTRYIVGSILSAGMLAAATLPASAALRVGVDGNATTNASLDVHVKLDNAARTKADAQINARIAALHLLKTRIGEMKRVSTSQKSSLIATLDTSITDMETLKAKIDADTDGATLKTDIQSITKSYRIYVLVMPQGRITAAGDRVLNIAAEMTDLSAKLQARIDAVPAGTDTTAWKTALADYNSKVLDATAQANAAIAEVAVLKPDNGDQMVFQANNKALQDARSKIKLAMKDLKTARQDAGTIVKALGKVKVQTSTSTSTSTTAQ